MEQVGEAGKAAASVYASAAAAAAAYAAYARSKSLSRSADLIRARVPWPVVRDALRVRMGWATRNEENKS